MEYSSCANKEMPDFIIRLESLICTSFSWYLKESFSQITQTEPFAEVKLVNIENVYLKRINCYDLRWKFFVELGWLNWSSNLRSCSLYLTS